MAEQSDHERRIEAALSADVPDIYANGFVTTIGAADVLLVLERHGRPEARMNLSYSLAKTLGESLSGAVQKFEEKTGANIPTTHDVDQAFGDD